jgi:oxygen-independent coproporphyrinogen-3 oxidase
VHLYVHVPFCARRCSYCDFAIAVRKEVPSRVYVDAVLVEAAQWRTGALTHGRTGAQAHESESSAIETLYFGGGTPSHLDPAELRRLIQGLRDLWPEGWSPRETTLETNPDDVTAAKVRAWVAAGIDRASLGVQSFEPTVLEWMHRVHTSKQSLEAIKALRGEGIENVSVDLIYALPPELKRDWARDLDQALALEPDHLSLYGLTVEPHTPLFKWVEGKKAKVADEDRYAEEFLLAHERLTAAGYEHYEVSNYGRPGRRAIHNSAYWQRRPFLGLGPSAHSAIGDRRWWNVREYAAWLDAGAQGRGGAVDGMPATVDGVETIDDERRRLEDLYLGLRTSDGLKADLITDDRVAQWVGQGWAVNAGGIVRLTPEGWLRLDALVAQVA